MSANKKFVQTQKRSPNGQRIDGEHKIKAAT